MKLSSSGPAAGPARRGFALIVTIVLVAFLVLILVGLATFTRVETQVASNSQQLAQARQNALMALNLALGKLQETTGPDQRVTATADLQPRTAENSTTDAASGESLTGTTDDVLEDIDAYWRASRNRRWTGAWKNGNASVFVPDRPYEFNAQPELQAWLVSGNEQVGDAFLPGDPVAGLTLSALTSPNAAARVVAGAGGDYRILVGANTANIMAAGDLDRAVVAPQMAIQADPVPGLAGPQTVGHYAWWIGDEGVKAKADIVDAYADGPDAEENRTRLQSAQRPVIEAMNAGLAGVYPSNDTRLEKLMNFDQLGFLTNSADDLKDHYRPRFHDLTLFSRGVLSDSRRGGLRGDFSKILGQTSDSDARADLRTITRNGSLELTDVILTPETTVYAEHPSDFIPDGNYALGLERTPTWAQLRSYFNMGNLAADSVAGVMASSSGDTAISRVHTETTHGIGPRLMQVKLFFGLGVDASTKAVSLQVRPLIVLANPYNIDLRGNWWVRVSSPSVQLRIGEFTAASPPPAYPESTDTASFPTTHDLSSSSNPLRNYGRRLNLALKNVVIPAGEARIYCLRQDYADPGTGSPLELELTAGLDELNAFTWATGVTLVDTPPNSQYAALYTGSSRVEARLYGADPAGNPSGQPDANLINYVYGQPPAADGACFLVQPVNSGTAQGGGSWFVVRDSLLTAAPSFARQMSPFVQYNYRALYHINAGFGGTADHVLETARTFTQKNASNAPDKFLSDLLLDLTDPSVARVRWGPVTKGVVGAETTAPSGVGDDTGFRNILYDLPRPGRPIVSVGQLQHFNPTGFIRNGLASGGSSGDPKGFAVLANTFQLNYPIGNSYANPWVGRHRVLNADGKGGTQYDGSWLFNEIIADRFFFSSYHATDDFDFGSDRLLNARLKPFRDRALVRWDDEGAFRGTAFSAAKNLLIDGAFNINSTSVEAWKAVLSGLRGVPVAGDGTVNVPFVRTLYQPEKYAGARTADTKEAWAGFSNLSDAEIDDLAREIVLQVRRRGPFLSLADFYNRRLVPSADDPAAFKLGASGALQAALDAVVNLASIVDAPFQVQSPTSSFADTVRPADFRLPSMTAGAPGYLLQGDMLSPLAQTLSARSDTFVIRTYGDAYNPATNETTAQAWCEAVVQRLPDYVVTKSAGGNDPEEIPLANSVNERFGRRYQIIFFRWLSPDDV